MIYFLLIPVILFLLLSGFFSGAETGAYRVNPVRLQLRSNQGHAGAIRLRRLLDDRQGILSVTLLGTNLANYLTTVSMAVLLGQPAGELSDRELELYTTLILTPVIFVFGEVVPKNWFRQEADRLMTKSSVALAGFDKAFRWCGAVPILKWLTGRMLRWWHGSADWEHAIHPRSKMVSLLKESVAEGVLTAEQSKLLDGVLSLSNVSVGSVMVPMSRVVMLPRRAARDDVLATIREHKYSRYPVMGTKQVGASARGRTVPVLGVINVYEFLAEPAARSIDAFIAEPLTLSPKSSVSAALYDMREQHRTFGIVVDRWSNCIGVVTVKDLVEEIVGDLAVW